MFSLRHLKAMVLLVLINLLSFGSTQVHSQGYGDTRAGTGKSGDLCVQYQLYIHRCVPLF